MAVRTHSFPKTEDLFDQFVRNFVKQMGEHPKDYHISAERLQRLQTELNAWDTNSDAAMAARDAAKAATEAKEQARTTLEDDVRGMIRLIQADPTISDEARIEAGISIPKTTRTPVPPPRTTPTGSVMSTDRLEHTVSYADMTTPTRRARPEGVSACEIYVAVGAVAPTDPKQYRFVGLSTRTPDVVTFESEDGGKTAHYLLRWVNTKGEVGPWSQVISATIPAV